MATFDTTELDRSIESFQETIQALKEIEKINKKLGIVADKIGEQDATLKADSEKLQRVYQQINFALEDLKGTAKAYTADIKNIFGDQKKDLSDLQSDLIDSQEKAVAGYIERTEKLEQKIAGKLDENVKTVAASTETVEKAVRENIHAVNSLAETVVGKAEITERNVLDYTTSTQKSIDELRVLETNNARETRDKIVETDARARAEMDAHFKSVEQLTSELALMKAQQRKAQVIGIIGGASAIIAAVASVLHFFF